MATDFAELDGSEPLIARTQLPVEMRPREDFSVWEFLKNCIGKELTKITMPVNFNEPLSFLQRVCEYLEYAQLLFKAEKADDPVERIELITAFAVSGASSNWARLGKPFNPLQGETYELDRSQDRGYRAVCEQVSHHPPTSAFHAEALDGSWIFHGAVTPKLSFLGKSVEVNPKGYVTLEFPRRSEVYTWQNVLCKIHNIIVGKLWVEHYGDLAIRCHTSGFRSDVKWHEYSLISSDHHKLSGYVFDPSGRKVRAIYGKWMDSLYSLPVDTWKRYKHGGSQRKRTSELPGWPPAPIGGATNTGANRPRWKSFSIEVPSPSKPQKTSKTVTSEEEERAEVLADGERELAGGGSGGGASGSPVRDDTHADLRLPEQLRLWRHTARPADSERYFSFTSFALALNDNTDADLMARLPPTDTRWKPDVRALELGDFATAQEEKTRLEEKQRRALKPAGGGPASPGGVWFRPWRNPHTGKEGDWRFTGDYWGRDWDRCPNIF